MNLIWVIALLGALSISVKGLAPQRQVLITYPSDTPQATLSEYRSAIIAAGGEILHEFNLIKYDLEKNAWGKELNECPRGFIAKASTEALTTIHSLSQDYPPTIEDDQTVTTQEQGH